MSKGGFIGNGLTHKLKKIYIGAPLGDTPITPDPDPEPGEGTSLSVANIDSFFSVTTGTTDTNKWTLSDDTTGKVKLVPGNIGTADTAEITLTAKRNLTGVVVSGAYYLYRNYCELSLTIAGTSVISSANGTSALADRWTGSLNQGQSIVLSYIKDMAISVSNEVNTAFYVACDAISSTTTQAINDSKVTSFRAASGASVARKIKKGYIGDVNNKARLWFLPSYFEYTGNYTKQTIEINGKNYDLYTLTSSGTLKCSEAKFWMCGGGAGGQSATNYCSGGGGGGGHLASGDLAEGQYSVMIGAGGLSGGNAGGITSAGNHSANGAAALSSNNGDGGSGGSGGGAGSYCNSNGSGFHEGERGLGDGVSTYPFNVVSLYAHCGGGGGADDYCAYKKNGSNYGAYGYGGAGGTNGGNGNYSDSTDDTSVGAKRTGGERGGGDGGQTYFDGSSATFFGSGGGGGSRRFNWDSWTGTLKKGGAGYQGVMYVLQEAA